MNRLDELTAQVDDLKDEVDALQDQVATLSRQFEKVRQIVAQLLKFSPVIDQERLSEEFKRGAAEYFQDRAAGDREDQRPVIVREV